MQLRNIKKSFGTSEVLHGVNLEIKKGSHTVIFGPSGSGKSTVLRTMNLLEVPDSGSVIFEGKAYTSNEKSNSSEKIGKAIDLRRNVGMVFQQFNLFPHHTALDNIAVPLKSVTDMSMSDARNRAAIELKKVGLLKWAGNFPNQLSGGQ